MGQEKVKANGYSVLGSRISVIQENVKVNFIQLSDHLAACYRVQMTDILIIRSVIQKIHVFIF